MRQIVAAIWGLGKAGNALALSLTATDARLAVVHNRGAARRTHFLKRHTPQVRTYARVPAFLRAMEREQINLLFLAVPDDALADVANRLSRASWLPENIVHLSGARGAEALDVLAPRAHIATFHPLAALHASHAIPAGALLAIDARHPPLRQSLRNLARAMELEPATVRAGQHARYHAGAVVSANLAVALLHKGIELLVHAGIPENVARRGLAHLLGSTANAARSLPLPQMLTGPIARGDVGTVRRHLTVIEPKETLELYVRLSRHLLDVAHLSDAQRSELRATLDAYAPSDAAD